MLYPSSSFIHSKASLKPILQGIQKVKYSRLVSFLPVIKTNFVFGCIFGAAANLIGTFVIVFSDFQRNC